MQTEDVSLLILAAGRSERFGAADKLQADLYGQALGLHLPERLVQRPWAAKLAIVCGPFGRDIEALGFELVQSDAVSGLGDNIAKGVRALGSDKPVLICLADMPFVSLSHIDRLVATLSESITIVASEVEGATSPPVLFAACHYEKLAQLSGDAGAREVIVANPSSLARVSSLKQLLMDVDTPEMLRHARSILESGLDLR